MALDKEAQRLGIQREAIIKLCLAERLDANPGLKTSRVCYHQTSAPGGTYDISDRN